MNKVFIIAEAGVNHNGDIEIAKRLVDAAAEAGADAVKFQTFKAEQLVCRDAKKAGYQLATTDASETQYDMLKKLELTLEMHEILMKYCEQKNIMFLSTPFDIDSLHYLVKLGVGIIKLPSGEITNYPLLKETGETRKKVILSTGMSSMDEVKAAVNALRKAGTNDITLLHCNTQYPTPVSDVNLLAMVRMREQLGVPTGYSDHTQGIEIPIAAAALGAVVIEKHFTLDKSMEGPDHRASLEPDELRRMVEGIRSVEQALGNGIKKVTESEKENIRIVRKSIVAKNVIKVGDILAEENLTTKRPGTGINPMRWNEVIGKIADRDYEADEIIQI
ncbi:MAG TPA: N-acetylneuraminate synthase [Lachnospiraceae bacterium]|nr:N-acetylneuraminate synthase [Lachnospiraceae bacterium]